MDDYLTSILFAANLLEYLLRKNHIPWDSPYNNIFADCVEKEFNDDIGEAVYTIWERKKNTQLFKPCQKEFRDAGVDKDFYSKCAVSKADTYFPEGYDHGQFLGYCAFVLGLSVNFFQCPSNGIPEMAADVIALVLFSYQMTCQFYKQDGWEGLREVSRQFNIACEREISLSGEKPAIKSKKSKKKKRG